MTEEMDDIEDWTVSVEEGTVGFGSALYKWGVSMPSMQRTGMASATSSNSNAPTSGRSSTRRRRFRTSSSTWSPSTSPTRSTPSPVVSRASGVVTTNGAR